MIKIKRNALLSLITINVLTIIIAVLQNWQISSVIWIFVIENFMVGFFNILRIVSLKHFDTRGVKINKRPLPTNPTKSERIWIKLYITFFFLIHYGMFNLTYVAFLGGQFSEGLVIFQDPIFYILAISFIINHTISFNSYLKDEGKRNQNIGTVMFRPYFRVLPVHLFIVFGLFLFQDSSAVVVFLLFSFFFQVLGHFFEHRTHPKSLNGKVHKPTNVSKESIPTPKHPEKVSSLIALILSIISIFLLPISVVALFVSIKSYIGSKEKESRTISLIGIIISSLTSLLFLLLILFIVFVVSSFLIH
jgi:hypothetical protein